MTRRCATATRAAASALTGTRQRWSWTDSQLITAVDVLPGNAPDNLGALELVEQSEANTGVPVAEVLGDAAYGDGGTRQAFADAGRTLIARVPGRPNRTHFPKEDFRIDLEAGTCTCPAGQVARIIRPSGTRTGPGVELKRLRLHSGQGRICTPKALLQQARALILFGGAPSGPAGPK